MTHTLTPEEAAAARPVIAALQQDPEMLAHLRETVASAGIIDPGSVRYLADRQPTSAEEAFAAAYSEPLGMRKVAYYALGVLWRFGVRSQWLAFGIAVFVTVGGGAELGSWVLPL